MTAIFENPAALLEAPGQQLGPTDWLEITQQRIDQFADATGDHQWIHVDPQRAKDGPFGATIAHGYLSLSLANCFPAPVPVGSRLRGVGEVISAEEVKGGVQVVVRVTVEIEGGERPACVVDTISRFYPG